MPTFSSIFIAAQPFVIGLGLPISIVALGVELPIQFAQQAAIGAMTSKVDGIRADVDRLTASIDTLSKRVDEREADPAKLLAGIIGVSGSDLSQVSVAYIKGGLVAFPRTEDMQRRFQKAGYAIRSVLPMISGYVLKSDVLNADPKSYEPKYTLPYYQNIEPTP